MEKTISNLLHRDFHNHFSKVIVNSTENNASNLSYAVSIAVALYFAIVRKLLTYGTRGYCMAGTP